jgi:hypothetical protein
MLPASSEVFMNHRQSEQLTPATGIRDPNWENLADEHLATFEAERILVKSDLVLVHRGEEFPTTTALPDAATHEQPSLFTR